MGVFVCVCMCVCVRVCACVYVYVCVYVFESEKGSQKDDTHLNSGISLDEIGEKVLDLY